MEEDQKTTGTPKRIFEEVDVLPNEQEKAQKATAMVFRDETVDLSSRYLALARRRVKLMESVYDNIDMLNNDIFNAENFRNMDMKEKLFAMSIHFKAIAALSVPLDQHKEIVNQINTQINLLMRDSNEFKDISPEKRSIIKHALEEMVTGIVKGKSDVALLKEDIKKEPPLK